MKHWVFGPVLLTVAALAGCLSDSDSLAGIEGTGSPATVSGSVTAYGSIYVNGVHIEIDTAELSVNGQAAAVDDIKLGMVVEVDAASVESGQAVASEVRYGRALRGTVSELVSVTETRRELVMLGQTLVVYDDTQFDGLTFEELGEGIAIDVSGFVDAEGRWLASRVAAADTNADIVFRGTVGQLDEEAQQFRVNALTVIYADADLSGDTLSDGAGVHVAGGEIIDGVLRPLRIEVIESEAPSQGATLFKEGVIGRYESRSEFVLNGITVDASQADLTGLEEDLTSGVRVSVSGQFEGDVLVADRLLVTRPGVNRIRTTIDDVDADAGELVLMGTRYQSTALTAFENSTASARGRGRLGQLRSGDSVEVFAYYRGDQLIVTRVKRLADGDGTVDLRGPVTDIDVNNQVIQVMGVTVSLQGSSGLEVLSDLRRGDQVLVTGQMSGLQALAADQLRIPDRPDDVPGCVPPVSDSCEGVSPLQFEPDEASRVRFRF